METLDFRDFQQFSIFGAFWSLGGVKSGSVDFVRCRESWDAFGWIHIDARTKEGKVDANVEAVI